MPTRVESDLYFAIDFGCSIEVVVEAIDTERVPIGEDSRSTRPVPRSKRLAAPNIHQ
jgi:hypothetical protein